MFKELTQLKLKMNPLLESTTRISTKFFSTGQNCCGTNSNTPAQPEFLVVSKIVEVVGLIFSLVMVGRPDRLVVTVSRKYLIYLKTVSSKHFSLRYSQPLFIR